MNIEISWPLLFPTYDRKYATKHFEAIFLLFCKTSGRTRYKCRCDKMRINVIENRTNEVIPKIFATA